MSGDTSFSNKFVGVRAQKWGQNGQNTEEKERTKNLCG